MKNYISQFLKFLKKFIDSDEINPILRKPFYIKWLFSGSFLVYSIKIILLFTSIWAIGLGITTHEGTDYMGSGKSSFTYSNKDSLVNDIVYVAENNIIINLFPKNEDCCYYSLQFICNTKNDTILDSTLTFNNLKLGHISDQTHFAEIDMKLFGYTINNTITSEKDSITISYDISGLGYVLDYGSIFMFMGLIIAFILFRFLCDKFIFAFTGIEDFSKIGNHKTIEKSDFDESKGLLRITNENRLEELKQNVLEKIEILSFHGHKFLIYTSWAIFAVVVMYFSLTNRSGNWNFSIDTYKMSYWFNQVKDFSIYAILIPPVLFKVIIIFYSTIKISYFLDTENLYQLKILAYDNAGGLSPLGDIALYQFYMFVAFSPHIYASAYILNFPTYTNILLPAYLLFTFLLFFVPLNSPHKTMKKAREDSLKTIGNKYETLNNDFNDVCLEGNDFKKLYSKMKKIKKLYDERRKMPVWPYDFEIFVKFGTVFIVNLLAYLSQYFVNLFS